MYKFKVIFSFVAVFLCNNGDTINAAELPVVAVHAVAEVTFTGPWQSARDTPARDIQLEAHFRHESGKPTVRVHGFFDGDGLGGIEGRVFKVRFCPTQSGQWTIVAVNSNAQELDGQHQGDTLMAFDSDLPGFWLADEQSAGGRWYRRSNGSHPYIIGNTHYTFLTEHGLDGQPTGSSIRADIASNAKYFKKLRFGLQGGRYPHPTDMPWLDDQGLPSDDGNFSYRPNSAWFGGRVDVAVAAALDHDLIADLILAGPDTLQSRSTLKAAHNDGDATPYLRYIAARYGSYPNVWICLCNEYDIKNPNYTQSEVAGLGVTIRKCLPYPTPVSVHDGSKLGWSAEFDLLPHWADHQIIQKKLRTIAPAADAIDHVWVGESRETARRGPTVNDELSYQGEGDKHTEADTIAAHLGAFLGGGYGTTGEKYGQKLGQYFWGAFDAQQHSAADNLRFLREVIDREITFWLLAPSESADVFPNLEPRFRVMARQGQEYVLGTDAPRSGLSAQLPEGQWTVTRYDVISQETTVLSEDADGQFDFDSPDSRAVLFHFERNTSP
ncbi:MAG: DUF5060 domain-containing protein [Planctomycetales bacterium]|nr:DUF5060 domain-containing protein [Planctomycetales bacterium]